MPMKETSQDVSSIASRLLHEDPISDTFVTRLIDSLAHANNFHQAKAFIQNELAGYVADVRKVAASALGQDETRG